jgi:hypothetical protein
MKLFCVTIKKLETAGDRHRRKSEFNTRELTMDVNRAVISRASGIVSRLRFG